MNAREELAPDAGPWCACGAYRVPVPTAVCPVCIDDAKKADSAAMAAILHSPRWAGFGFGRKGQQ